MIRVVIKGWPATAASTFLSFRTCSTCFSLMTAISWVSPSAFADYRRGVHTIYLLQNLQRKDFMPVLWPWVRQPCQPDAREGAYRQPRQLQCLPTEPGRRCVVGSNVPVPRVFMSSKSSMRSCCEENPSRSWRGSCASCSADTVSCPTAIS